MKYASAIFCGLFTKETSKVYLKNYLLVLVTFLVAEQVFAQPTISSFSPTSGPVGTVVTITGTNFNTTAANNVVYVGAVKAVVSLATSTSLTITIPNGATYQPITVTSSNLTAYAAQPFNVTFPGGGAITATSFAAKVDYPLSAGGTESISSDVDGDGKADILYAYGSKIGIVRNTTTNGIVSFGSEIDLLGSCAYGFAIGDIDGDGKMDIVSVDGCNDFISIFKNTSTSGSVSFATRLDFPTTSQGFVYKVEVADFDGDGKPDIAVVNLDAATMSVFKNNSIGGIISFGARVDFATGNSPRNLVLADLNKDGKTDIVVANQFSRSVSVFKNSSVSGTIAFSSRTDYLATAGGNPEHVSAADFDGDGMIDLAVTNNNDPGTMSVFRNTGTSGGNNISFGTAVDYALGSGTNPYALVLADLDGDGKPEAVVTNQNAPTFSIFRNSSTSGNITFAPRVDYATGSANRKYLTSADLNADGKPDLILTDANSINTSVFFNKVDGPNITSFTPLAAGTNSIVTITGTNFTGTTSVTFGGTNAASFTVVNATTITSVIGSGTSGEIVVTTPLGQGRLAGFTFTGQSNPIPTITSINPASGSPGTAITITGTNFNTTATNNIVYFGAVKAAVSNATGTSLAVTVPFGATYQPITVTTSNLTAYSAKPFKVTSSRVGVINTGSFASKVDYATGNSPYSVMLSDFDSDGKPDMAAVNLSSNSVSVLRNQAAGATPSFATKVDFSTGSQPVSFSAGDLDGDGNVDLAISNIGSNSISVLKNSSVSGNISFAAKTDFTTGNSPRGLIIQDLDGDGKSDMAVVNYGSNTISTFRNTSSGPGVITFAAKVDFPTGSGPVRVVVGDLDGDGKADLVVSNLSSNTISVLRNTSTNGSISFAPKSDFATGNAPYSLSIGDLDGDGKSDIAVANQSSNSLSILRNTASVGAVSFDTKVDYSAESVSNGIFIEDLDGDGKPDLIVVNGNNAGTVSVYKNSGSGGTIAFMNRVNYNTGSSPSSITVGDVNGDGNPDLIAGNNNDNTVSLLINQITSASLPLNLISFSGKETTKNIQLQWLTSNEQNTSYFLIDHSVDGISYSTIGNVAASGNTTTEKNYNFIHGTPNIGINYYRLKMVDADGKFTYSQVVLVDHLNDKSGLSVYPNPAKEYIIISNPAFNEDSKLKLVDMSGQVVRSMVIKQGVSQTRMNLKGLIPGTYRLLLNGKVSALNQTVIIR